MVDGQRKFDILCFVTVNCVCGGIDTWRDWIHYTNNAKPKSGEQKPEDPAWDGLRLESENVVSKNFRGISRLWSSLRLFYLTTRADSRVHCSALSARLVAIKRRTEAALECETFWFGFLFAAATIQHSSSTRSNFYYISRRMRASAHTQTHTHIGQTQTSIIIYWPAAPSTWELCVRSFFFYAFIKILQFGFTSALLSFGMNFLHFFLYFSVFFGLMRYSCFELRCCYFVDRKEKPESNAFVRRFRDEAKALWFFFLFHSKDFGPNVFRWRLNLTHKY